MFKNPIPVAVSLVPHKGKLVGIRRGIEPRKGQVAFPGGYISSGESFTEALSRELVEETGIIVSADSWETFLVNDSVKSNRILIFGICPEISEIDMDFISNESEEIVLVSADMDLAFPLHNDAKNKYFNS